MLPTEGHSGLMGGCSRSSGPAAETGKRQSRTQGAVVRAELGAEGLKGQQGSGGNEVLAGISLM